MPVPVNPIEMHNVALLVMKEGNIMKPICKYCRKEINLIEERDNKIWMSAKYQIAAVSRKEFVCMKKACIRKYKEEN